MALDSLIATSAYQPEPQSAAAARHFVRETLQSWQGSGYCGGQDGMVDDAVLLTSELVTNAVVHAGTSVQVTCRLADEVVEIAVVDHSPVQLIPDEPQTTAFSEESTNGRGLQLPSELASSWGVTYARTFKAVWFRMGLGSGQSQMTGRCGAPGLLATSGSAQGEIPALAGEIPALAGERPARGGERPALADYSELLRSIVQTARAGSGADAAYLMIAGDDGEMRVRAASGAGLLQVAGGSVPQAASVTRALAPAALSLVTVPLVAAGRVTGILVIAGAEPGRFRERDAERLQRLADTSAAALEQARLDDLESGRQERLRFLAEASDLLAASQDRENILALGVQFVIANLAAWCAVLLAEEAAPGAPGAPGAAPRLAQVAHASPARTAAVEWLLSGAPPPAMPGAGQDRQAHGARPGWRWELALPPRTGCPPPGAADIAADQAWCFPLVSAGRTLGLLVIGGPGTGQLAAHVAELADGLARRVAGALDALDACDSSGSGLARGDLRLPAGDMTASVLRSC